LSKWTLFLVRKIRNEFLKIKIILFLVGIVYKKDMNQHLVKIGKIGLIK